MSSASDDVTVIEINHDHVNLPDDSGCANHGLDNGESKNRYWFFTINNPAPALKDGKTLWATMQSVFGSIRGGVAQVEKASTVHIQGCFSIAAHTRLQTMRNRMRSQKLRGWIRPCVHYPSAVKYCSKEDTRVAGPFWFGNCTSVDSIGSKQGTRTDLDVVAKDIADGRSLRDVAENNPPAFIKYHAGIKAYASLVTEAKPRDFVTELHIYWGASGTGKSRRAWYEGNQRGKVYVLKKAEAGHVVWWPGYSGQETVIIDDYNGWLELTELFKLADRYPTQVRTAGETFVEFTSRVIVITSNVRWEIWYAAKFMANAEWKDAFGRRITRCVEFRKENPWLPPGEIMQQGRQEDEQQLELEAPPMTPLCLPPAATDAAGEEQDPGDASPISIQRAVMKHHATHCSAVCNCAEWGRLSFINWERAIDFD